MGGHRYPKVLLSPPATLQHGQMHKLGAQHTPVSGARGAKLAAPGPLLSARLIRMIRTSAHCQWRLPLSANDRGPGAGPTFPK